MKRTPHVLRISLVALLALVVTFSFLPTARLAAQAPVTRYLVIAKADELPDGLADQVTAAGGTITAAMPEIGVIAVESANPDFAATVKAIKGVRSVVRDVSVSWVPAQDFVAVGQTPTFDAPASTGDDFFFPFQWNMDAIDAPEAWAAGVRGSKVRVAVLDGGFELSHPDFLWLDTQTMKQVNNMDAESGRSFVLMETLPGEEPKIEPLQFNNTLGVVSHATHVAGIIAAADNGIGVIGVAPEATIVPIKVLRDSDGRGDFSWIIQGIYYAASLRGNKAVDVINMSLGAEFPRNGLCDEEGVCVMDSEVSELVNALTQAISYAGKQGITVVAAAGNNYPPINMDQALNLIYLPADIPGVLTVSATGPIGWGPNPSTNLDLPAPYSNYGQTFVDFAAPGGNTDLNFYLDFLYYGCQFSPLCAPISDTFPYPVGTLDWVWSTDGSVYGDWTPLTGTSMAAPHVAGVAALIIGQYGGHMKPSQVEEKLRQSADDLGVPGNDEFYGQGRINAYNAVK